MAHQFTLPEFAKIVGAMQPATDAAGRTGRYVTLKNAHKAYIIFHINQANAATVACSVVQATAVAGTGSKALSAGIRWWSCLDVATSDTLVRRSDGASYTTDAGLKEKVVVAEIDPAALDQANGFDCIAPVTGASNVANITESQFILAPYRYPGDSSPTATTD